MAGLIPASELSTAELAALFTRAYEGYLLPFALDEAALGFMLAAFDYDVEGSLVVPGAGLAMLGLRGREAWCGGVGVVPERRGEGLGRELMLALHDSARARGARRIRLEVIDRNVAARSLYEQLRYVHVRDVHVWSLGEAAAPAAEAREVPLDDALAAISARRDVEAPWQRADGTVQRLRALEPGLVGLEVGDAVAIVRVSGGRVTLVQAWAPDEASGRELVLAARARGESLHVLNVPEDDPLAASLAAAGASPDIRQHELALDL